MIPKYEFKIRVQLRQDSNSKDPLEGFNFALNDEKYGAVAKIDFPDD
jgi:hypothetical protein